MIVDDPAATLWTIARALGIAERHVYGMVVALETPG
jgi:hypothetical protein